MEEDQLYELAVDVVAYMRQEKAVRLDEDTVGNYLTVYDLAQAMDFPQKDWAEIKTEIIAQGHAICWCPGKGHYLGFPGEDAFNVYFADRMANGWRSRSVRYAHAMHGDDEARVKFMRQKYDVDWLDILKRQQ